MQIYYKYFAIIILCAAMAISGCATSGPYLKLDPGLQKDVRVFDNTQYIALEKLCGHYGLRCDWDSFVRTATIEKDGKRIVLRAGSDRMLVDGIEKRLDRQAVVNNGAVYVPVTFVRNNLGTLVKGPAIEERLPSEFPKAFSIRTVVIDAGHGGRDVGATGRRTRLKEKTMTLAVSKKLKSILEERGLKAILTRSADTFIPLSKRVQIANKNGADLFVSIHINASRTNSLNGFECYYIANTADDNARALTASENAMPRVGEGAVLRHTKALDRTLWDMTLSENRAESARLAKYICDAVGDNLSIRNRRVKSARFYVLKLTHMPAVLVEMGYLSNRAEEMKLKDQQFLDKMTEAVAKGILAYKDEYEKTGGYTNA